MQPLRLVDDHGHGFGGGLAVQGAGGRMSSPAIFWTFLFATPKLFFSFLPAIGLAAGGHFSAWPPADLLRHLSAPGGGAERRALPDRHHGRPGDEEKQATAFGVFPLDTERHRNS